jgi:hypothetical protein
MGDPGRLKKYMISGRERRITKHNKTTTQRDSASSSAY